MFFASLIRAGQDSFKLEAFGVDLSQASQIKEHILQLEVYPADFVNKLLLDLCRYRVPQELALFHFCLFSEVFRVKAQPIREDSDLIACEEVVDGFIIGAVSSLATVELDIYHPGVV